MVFQSPVLMKWRTILDNVLFPIDALGLRRRDYLDKAQALLKLAGLEAFAKARPNELSGGMQQRAALCRALIYDPPFLLMDEPFGALDALTRDQMNVELMRIWSETRKATLLITHSVAEAVFLADRVLVMSGRPGTILADVAIDLPRPRQTRVRTTPVFAEYVRRLSAMLGVHD
jgi:NitT/TauT family transport system ATP-binding protein